MIGVIFVLVFAAILVGIMMASGIYTSGSRLPHVILGGYFLRLILRVVFQNVQLFSHAIGGDYLLYEIQAKAVILFWEHEGFQYVSAAKMPDLGVTSLPANLFAAIQYMCGDSGSETACTALIALCAAITVINIYSLAIEFGATKRSATLFAILFYFQPSFLYYTSDMYKDGLVLCFEMVALGSALRLSRGFNLLHGFIGAVALLGLWNVRHYLVFVTGFTLLISFVGIGERKNVLRSAMAILVMVGGLVLIALYSSALDTITADADRTFEAGTSEAVLGDNATGGSGVTFDDGGKPWGALHWKVLYTLFSPFLWAGGSLGFQLAKIDVLVWYYVMYRAYQAVRTSNRSFVAMIATFVVPCTIMYATSMANVGLMVRQRLVILAATFLLAATFDPTKQHVQQVKAIADPLMQRLRATNQARSAARAARS